MGCSAHFFSQRLEGGRAPANVLASPGASFLPPIFFVPKPGKAEKGPGNDHPTVKPIALLRYLIRLTTEEGAVVLDPFAGSGSTLVAARLEGRRFVGIEIYEHYLRIAKRHLEARSSSP